MRITERDTFKFVGQVRFDIGNKNNQLNTMPLNFDIGGIYLLGVHKRSKEIKLMKIGFNNV